MLSLPKRQSECCKGEKNLALTGNQTLAVRPIAHHYRLSYPDSQHAWDQWEMQNLLKILKESELFHKIPLKFLDPVWCYGTFGLFPGCWQKADVRLEPKKTGVQNQKNYRGIKLLYAGHKIHASITKNKQNTTTQHLRSYKILHV
jgi:hypothetical protein